MFENEELKVQEIEVLELTFANGEVWDNKVLQLAVKLLATIGSETIENEVNRAFDGFEKFKAGTEVNESLEIKVTLENDIEFTVSDVTAIFKIDQSMSL